MNETRFYMPPFRIAGSRSGAPPAPDRREDTLGISPIADLMMGAASLGEGGDQEQATVRGLLLQMLGRDELPAAIEEKLDQFNPGRFDLQEAVADFQARSQTSKRRLLELVRLVCEADNKVGLNEDNYLIGLALSLSMVPSEYRDLVVEESRGVNGPWKRLSDLVLGSLALVLAAPVMLACAVAVKLTSPGPVLFRQRRYGRGGKIIRIFKFRSMTTTDDGPVMKQATSGDPRITRVGRFLRRTSLDELPQLFNVLGGSMSLVGPRPHAVAHNEMYKEQIVEYMLRHKVTPGITGWAQVNGWRGETDTLRKMVYRVEYDLDYIREWNWWLDLKILWSTVFGRKVRQNAR